MTNSTGITRAYQLAQLEELIHEELSGEIISAAIHTGFGLARLLNFKSARLEWQRVVPASATAGRSGSKILNLPPSAICDSLAAQIQDLKSPAFVRIGVRGGSARSKNFQKS